MTPRSLASVLCLLAGIAPAAATEAPPVNIQAINPGVSQAIVAKKIGALNSNTIYSAGTVTYSAGVYTAAAGAQPAPAALKAGLTVIVNFPSANPGAASLVAAPGLGAKPIMVLDSAGAALTLAGGEIVPGPQTVYYDGSEFIYAAPVSRSVAVAASAALTQANFAARDTLYLAAGAKTLTLPCSATLSPNGQALLFSVSGAITLAVTGGCSPSDTITKNGSTATTQTIAQGAAAAVVATDANGHFYVSGP